MKSYYHELSGKSYNYERSPSNYLTIDVYDEDEHFYGTYDSLQDLRYDLDEEYKERRETV